MMTRTQKTTILELREEGMKKRSSFSWKPTKPEA